MGLDKLRASESCEWSQRVMQVMRVEPCKTDVSSQSIFLSSAFGGFWLFGTSFRILALLSIPFCYLPSSFSSFFKISYVICYYFSRVLNH